VDGKDPNSLSFTKLPSQRNDLNPSITKVMAVLEEPINASSATNITVLIVGAGVAGTLLALECSRHGFKPTIIERNEASTPAGMN
jgi:NADPH-dependent 2,4-dienoyl-CoA reductase/sulfur reductase-like enzyme